MKFKGNQFVRYQYLLAKRMLKRSLLVAFALTIGAWLVTGGIVIAKNNLAPKLVMANQIVEVPVSKKVPVMDRIAKCESGGNHIDPKTGQVYMLANTNKTVDVGKFMLNTVWHKKAKELGYDITKEEDNEKMAYWIYENFGTGAWVYSAHCWNR